MRLLKSLMLKLMGMPTCEEIEGFAYAYLEQELESELRRKFERHIRGCRDCDRFIQTYRHVAKPKRLLKKILLPPDFENRIVEFLKKG